MKLNAPRLARIRSHFSGDGQFAQFTMINKAGANLSFTIPFSELGTLMSAFQSVAKRMACILSANGAASAAQMTEGLANAPSASGFAVARDAESGDALLWFENEDGGTAVRLSRDVLRDLRHGLDQHDNESADRIAAE